MSAADLVTVLEAVGDSCPAAIVLVTLTKKDVTGTFEKADGTAVVGRVQFTPIQLVNATTNEIVVAQAVTEILDATGSLSVDLIPTDDTAYFPTPWVYTVMELFEGGRTYFIEVPTSGTAIDLADIVPISSWSSAEVTIKNPVFSTAGRPSAATAGVGAQIYDSTLSKPVWSNGAVWRDAMGTAV